MPRKAKPKPERRPPTKRETAQNAAASEWMLAAKHPPAVEVDGARVVPPHADEVGWIDQLHQTFGTASHDFMNHGIGALRYTNTDRGKQNDTEYAASSINAGLAIMAAVAPENEVEAALGLQMAGCHMLAIEMLGRAKHTDRTDHMQLYGGMAVKLQRTFAAQLETLAKIRTKGKQVVEVIHIHKHIHAAPGSQVVVGDIHQGGGGGADDGNSNQSHAQPPALAYAPGGPMRRADAEGAPLPVSGGGGEAPVPDARRDQPRRA
jgi:hypothetical protein